MINFILKNRLIILFVALIVGIAGILAFRSMSVDAYPDISGVQVQIVTTFSGRAAEEVEQQVTVPIERAMAGLPRMESIRSRSIFGLSLVQIIFAPEAEDYWARQVVNEKLGALDLPAGAQASLASLSTAYGEIYRYDLESKTKSPMELRTLNDWLIIPRILKVKGIVEVANFGGLGKQYAIALDPSKMLKFGISLEDVISSVQTNNSAAGGSFIDRGSSSLVIRGLGRIKDFQQLKTVFIKNSNGTSVYINDVGLVQEDSLQQTGIFGINDHADSVEGIVRMRRGENPSVVLDNLHLAIAELQIDLEKQGVTIKPFYDRAELVSETIHTVSHNVLIGIALVILTLIVFLGSWRTSVAVAIAIPFSLLFTFLLMKLTGIPVSLLSIGAVDFGIIVDGAIIMAEGMMISSVSAANIPFEGIKKGFAATLRPTLFSMVVIIITYLPLLSLRYIEGLLFKPMAITLCYSLIGALLFSVFVLPLLLSSSFLKQDHHTDPKWILRLTDHFENRLGRLLKSSRLVVGSFIVLFFITAAVIVPRLGAEFLPYMDEGVFWLRANFPEGISLKENAQYANQIRTQLKKFQEIAFVTSQTGRSDSGSDPFPMNRVEMMIGLKEKDKWRPNLTKLDLESEIRKYLAQEFPTTRFNLTQPIIDSVTEDANGTSANLAVEILGSDLPTLRRIGKQVVSILKSIPGGVNINIEQEGPQPQVKVDIDHARLASHQLNVQHVNTMMTTALAGFPVSDVFEGIRRFDIVVKYDRSFVNTIEKLSSIPLFNVQQEPIPLGEVSNIRIKEGETIIGRSDGRRRMTVRVDIRGRSQGEFVKEAQKQFKTSVKLPDKYEVQWLGMFENLDRAQKHFALLIPMTLGLIAFLLYLSFGSWVEVSLVFLTLPFAFVGAVISLFIRGMPLSVSAAVGFSSLFGVSSMYGILLMTEFRKQRAAGGEFKTVLFNSVRSVFRPVLLTAAVAILGLIPAMLSAGIGSDVQRPIATVIVGGLLSASLMTLFILPSFIQLVMGKRHPTSSQEV